jgi:hypothetical protein
MSAYDGLRLRDNDFRILRLSHDRRGLYGRLQNVSFGERVSYAAVSYAWGKPNAEGEIRLGGMVLPISRVLEDILWRLLDFGVRYVWVDQICIDQGSIPERNQQVRRMKDIYAGCEECFVYLGEGTGEDDDVGDLLEGLRLRYDALGIDWRNLPNGRTIKLPRVKENPFPRDGPWEALIDYIITQRYFTRTWVLQEIITSPKVTCIIGEQTVPWSALQSLALDIPVTRLWASNHAAQARVPLSSSPILSTWRLLGSSVNPSSKTNYALGLEAFSKFVALTERKEKRSLFELLQSCRTLQASDPKDKIFALLNVAADADRFPHPDYSMPTEEVYRRYTIVLANQGHHLSLLGTTGDSHGSNGWPSWIPRWEDPHPAFSWESSTKFMAGGARISDPRFRNNSMAVRAHIYDTVATRWKNLSWEHFYPDVTAHVEEISSDLQLRSDGLSDESDVARSIIRLLLCDPREHSGDYFEQPPEMLVTLPGEKGVFVSLANLVDEDGMVNRGLKRWSTLVYLLEDSRREEFRGSHISTMTKSTDGFWAPIFRFMPHYMAEVRRRTPTEKILREYVRNYIGSRGFAYLDYLQGKYQPLCVIGLADAQPARQYGTALGLTLGLAPATVRPGDKVALVRGARAPFILREVSKGKYRNLGQAYVRDVMMGEVANKLSKEDFPYVEIV